MPLSPAVLLQNDFLIVFASGKDRRIAGAPLHTSFNLSAGGEYLALVKPDGVTEIVYNPPMFGSVNADEVEFLEFKNVGDTTLVMGRNAAQLQAKYPGLAVKGIYSGRLDNGGEPIALTHALGAEILSFTYNDTAPWPVAPDGNGFSLVPRLPNSNPNFSASSNWRASSTIGGSPGADNPTQTIAPLVVNELLTHTVLPAVDRIEIYNPTTTNVHIGGWFLTDDSNVPKKYRVPIAHSLVPLVLWRSAKLTSIVSRRDQQFFTEFIRRRNLSALR